MKIKDIIKIVDKSLQFRDQIYIGDFVEKFFRDVLQSTFNYDEQHRLVAYYVAQWYCTDTYVGLRVYFFDDEPVAISMQNGRKMDEELEWFSEEAYKKVLDYVLSFEEKKEPNIELCDMNEEIGGTYKIEYYSNLFDYHKKNALLKGKPVTIIDKVKKNSIPKKFKNKYQECYAKIKHEDSTEEIIELRTLDFPFNLSKK